jgi:hypothetical protein
LAPDDWLSRGFLWIGVSCRASLGAKELRGSGGGRVTANRIQFVVVGWLFLK